MKTTIEGIKRNITQFENTVFEDDEIEFRENQKMRFMIRDFIIDSNNEEDRNLAIQLLAKSSGCAEDQEISEEIIEKLYESKVIHRAAYDLFFDNLNTGRWD